MPNPAETTSVVLDASLEVRSAIVYACFIEASALLPIFFLNGLTGSFFKPLATAYALAVLVSLMVALLLHTGDVPHPAVPRSAERTPLPARCACCTEATSAS